MESIFSLRIPSTEYDVINYPLIIQNEAKALKSIGGLNAVSELLKINSTATTKKRISLHLRPDMIYSKPLLSEHSETKGVLIKMRQLRNKKTGEIKVVPEMLGQVKNMYEFNYLCDYEHNPHRSISLSNDVTNVEVLYDKLLPKESFMNLEDLEKYMDSINDVFLPPISFTKSEKPADLRLVKVAQEPHQNSARKNDCNTETEWPNWEISLVKELFEKQPMWTATSMYSALKDKGMNNDHRIRRARKELSDHILTGPWRRSWVLKDYNYKIDPSTRMFQVIEFRGNPSHINSVKKYIQQSANKLNIEESNWKIGEKHLPTSINCFYQLCHIEIPEVIAFIQSQPVPAEPSEQYGWFETDMPNKVREIIQKFLADQIAFLLKNNKTAL